MRADKIQKIKRSGRAVGLFEKSKSSHCFLGPRNRNDMRENNRNDKRKFLREETEKNVTLRGNEIP